MLFNLIKTLLFELFIVLKFLYNTSSRILNKPTAANQQEVNLETVKGDENNSLTEIELQKFHHKKAFEHISQALRIDETQNPGVYKMIKLFVINIDGQTALYGNSRFEDDVMSFLSAHVQ